MRACVLLALVGLASPARAADWSLLAHRGASSDHPENTLSAFRAAAALGVGFELDVTLAATGEVIVLHDDTVDRTTDGSGAAGDLTLDEIRGLDAGSWFAIDYAGERIPTLDEVLDELGGVVPIDIEIKSVRPLEPLADAVVALIQAHDVTDDVIVTSFDALMLERVKEQDPSIRRGQITGTFKNSKSVRGLARVALKHMWLNNRSDPDVIVIEDVRARECFVKRQKRKGREVWAWTVDDPAEARELTDRGVTSIITNVPARLIEAPPSP